MEKLRNIVSRLCNISIVWDDGSSVNLAPAIYTMTVVLLISKLAGWAQISWIVVFAPIWCVIALFIGVIFFHKLLFNSEITFTYMDKDKKESNFTWE